MTTGSEISLTTDQRSELSSIAQSHSLPAGYVFRAKLILMLAQGASFSAIKRQLQTTAPTIVRWKQRFLQSGLDGLDTYHPGQKATLLTPALRARILSATRKKPSDGSTLEVEDQKTSGASLVSRQFWSSLLLYENRSWERRDHGHTGSHRLLGRLPA